MRVNDVTTRAIGFALPRPVGTALHSIESVGCVLVDVRTDAGAAGHSFVFTINADRLAAFSAMIEGLADHVVGRDPHDTEGIWHDCWMAVNPSGHKGVTISAMSALDVACWDAAARSADLPLHKMFGACRTHVDTYASSGLWLTASIDELQAEAAAFVDQGFTAVKMRIGSDHAGDDVARVAAVVEAVGPGVGVLVDANQKFTAKEAIRLGRRLEELELVWFEEPVATHDLRASSEVRAALATPIASGETEYTRYGIRALIDARAADVLMPDLQRIGGYSEFRKAAALAAAHDLPVSSHFFTELSLCLAGSLQNCVSVEHVDWFAPLFHEQLTVCDGRIAIPDRPGTGFTFDEDFVRAHLL